MPVWFLAVLTPGHQPGQAAVLQGPGQGTARASRSFLLHSGWEKEDRELLEGKQSPHRAYGLHVARGAARRACTAAGAGRWVPLVWDSCGIAGITPPPPALLPLGDSLGPAVPDAHGPRECSGRRTRTGWTSLQRGEGAEPWLEPAGSYQGCLDQAFPGQGSALANLCSQ